MENNTLKTHHLIVIGLFLLVAGCATPAAKFTHHVLHPAVSPSAEAGGWDPEVYVVVGPVELPAYLDKPQMVLRHSDHTLSFSEFQRWAEPLRKGISRAVAENLSRLTGAEKVAIYPFDAPQGSPSMRVVMDVVRFDADDDGKVTLDVRWGVRNGKSQSVTTGHTTLSGGVEGAGQPARTKALSLLLAEFSREVAETLKAQE
ncbi:hypothetical protein DSLASN_27040 [Desulfoluna limicola]|uniref:ABC-type transport auxiliary lipoprotein component domain-containing protein n=1 Tax=Desulfoluna limicola TaxID=2810562 RepID=A0ABM7PJ22_9BACT|nr:PqiC family protein [Desulfoluna limicola]BCS97072.1 hypothetical protein DSLASN_27040 [Desulfoluna limicola]